MKKYYFIFLATFTCVAPHSVLAQETAGIQMDKFSPSDFNISSPLINPATGAVVIADIGSSMLENFDGAWRVVFKRYKRIKILATTGFDACTVKILYSSADNSDSKLKDLKAFTYNQSNSGVKRTSLTAEEFYLSRTQKDDLLEEKFTFPNVKVGSIIEYSYTVKSSDIEDLYPWEFQGEYPRLWSEYSVILPHIFNYAVIIHGRQPFYKTTVDSAIKEIWMGNGNTNAVIYTKKWVMKDVPEVKPEPYVNCIDNLISKIHFQISIQPLKYGRTETILPSWQYVANRLISSEYFGVPLFSENPWLNNKVDSVTSRCIGVLDKAKKIFAFVRDNFQCKGNGIYIHSDLRQIFDGRQGNAGELNLLLIALLRKENIDANPVILSTKDNGVVNVSYPITENINYVIVRANIDNRIVYLDVSQKNIGFGKLPVSCYNGTGIVITKDCFPIDLNPDSLVESKTTTVFVTNNTQGGGQAAHIIHNAGYFESLEIRDALLQKKSEDYSKSLSNSFSMPAEMTNVSIDSLRQFEQPATIQYDINFDLGNENIIYFNPLINEVLKENPYVSGSRINPVELQYASSEVFVLQMEIPKGYEVQELPKSVKADLNGTDGTFEYRVANTDGQIQLLCKLIIRKTVFQPEDYQNLRDFYAFVIRKENEMIVLKKTN